MNLSTPRHGIRHHLARPGSALVEVDRQPASCCFRVASSSSRSAPRSGENHHCSHLVCFRSVLTPLGASCPTQSPSNLAGDPRQDGPQSGKGQNTIVIYYLYTRQSAKSATALPSKSRALLRRPSSSCGNLSIWLRVPRGCWVTHDGVSPAWPSCQGHIPLASGSSAARLESGNSGNKTPKR